MLALKDLLLREPALTLASAESMTCGRIQARIGAISGASKFFLGGITTYTIDQKVHHLGVDRALAESCNAVSSEIAEQMAIGACQLFGASLGLATTGYAENPVGRTHPFAWWALAHYLGDGRMAVQSGLIECPGAARTVAQDAAASAALGALVRYLHTLRP
ncbi:MAG: nicotinamide-nucleotide amidohydrolase family protein [Opitutaceae bacterium]|nr:nicotinamide-nucleotide amidohydrolase family protein [Opitutaceae bacterium]